MTPKLFRCYHAGHKITRNGVRNGEQRFRCRTCEVVKHQKSRRKIQA